MNPQDFQTNERKVNRYKENITSLTQDLSWSIFVL